MRRLINYSIILFVCINTYSQKIPPPESPKSYDLFTGCYYTENINGLLVYIIKSGCGYLKDTKASGYVRLMCFVDDRSGYKGEGLFVDGLRHKKWKLKKCDTDVHQEINYNKGLIIGYYKVFVERGTTKNGIWIKSNDSILYETNFVNGNGEWKNFYGSTRGFVIRETGFYENGKKSGEWCYYLTQDWCHNYTERGIFLHRKEYYENGILVKKEDFEIPEEYEPCLEH